jgi:putative endonuclease
VFALLYRLADRIRRRYIRNNHGRLGEDLAHAYLRARGCKIVSRNYRTRSGAGELDLVAWDGPTLVFVEVKTRKNDAYGSPDQAVDAEKRIRLYIGARDYIRRASIDSNDVRFDIVTVLLEPQIEIEWLRDAVQLNSAPVHPYYTKS